MTTLKIILALLSLVRTILSIAEQNRWMSEGARKAILQGLVEVENEVQVAQSVREAVRAEHLRDPSSIMRDDEFTRPD